MRATYDHMVWENDARTIATFYFRPESRYRYEAGQYAVIDVPHAAADKRGTGRTMTLSSSPNDPLLSITLRIIRNRGSSFKHALLTLRSGDEVKIYDSMGDLVLPLDASIPLVFIAGGVGIASYVGIMKWLLQQRQRRDISLYYAVARPEDIVLQKPFDSYDTFNPIRKKLYISEKTGNKSEPGFKGDITYGRITAADTLPGLVSESLIYISGTEKMVEDIRQQLVSAGVSRRNIIFDYFDGYNNEI